MSASTDSVTAGGAHASTGATAVAEAPAVAATAIATVVGPTLDLMQCADCGTVGTHSMLLMGCILILLTAVLVARYVISGGRWRSIHTRFARVVVLLATVIRRPPAPSLTVLSISRT